MLERGGGHGPGGGGGGHAGFGGGGGGGHWGPGPGGGGPAGPGPGGHSMVPVVHTGASSGSAHVVAHQTNVNAFHGGRRFFRGRGGIFSGAWPIIYPGAYWPLYYPVNTMAPTGPIQIDLGPSGILYIWAEGDIVYWSLNGSPWQATTRLNFNMLPAAVATAVAPYVR